MTIPLNRLHEAVPSPVGSDELALLVARDEAPVSGSPEVYQYARDRARVLHDHFDGKIQVKSWGDTDAAYPREYVELILPFAHEILTALATVLAALLMNRPKRDKPTDRDERENEAEPKPASAKHPVAGIKIGRAGGETLEITYQDGLTEAELKATVMAFLEKKPKRTRK